MTTPPPSSSSFPTPPSPAEGDAAQSPGVLAERLARAERELRDLSAGLAHADRLASLGTLAAMIAHEVNNLMTPIVAYAQLALASPHDHDLRVKALRRAEDHARRASQISEAILRFARPDGSVAVRGSASADIQATAGGGEGDSAVRHGGENGEGVASSGGGAAEVNSAGVTGGARRRPAGPAAEDGDVCHVEHALDGALSCLARDLEKDGIALVRDVRVAVRMRPVALQQVLLNLILNARRAMLKSGGTLTVRSRVASPTESLAPAETPWNRVDRWMAVIEVSDTGGGVPPGRAEQLFRAFERGPESGQSEGRAWAGGGGAGGGGGVGGRGAGGGGSGLGLAVSRRLVEEAGGRVWMESAPGLGTTVRMVLPAAGGAGAGGAAREQPPAGPDGVERAA